MGISGGVCVTHILKTSLVPRRLSQLKIRFKKQEASDNGADFSRNRPEPQAAEQYWSTLKFGGVLNTKSDNEGRFAITFPKSKP